MGLFDFIKTADPQKVQAVEVQKGDDRVTLLESTRHCFMPLVIPAAGGSSSAAAAEISVSTKEGQEDVALEEAYLELADPDEGMTAVRQSGEELSIPIHHAGDNTAVGETFLSFTLMNVYARAEGAKKHVAALRQLMMEIVSAPLSSQTWVGEASTSVAPLSVEDYDEEDMDEALGSVVAVPKLETCRF
ncbi:hypothetical protein Tco_0106489 [Tanacetum coccineum]